MNKPSTSIVKKAPIRGVKRLPLVLQGALLNSGLPTATIEDFSRTYRTVKGIQ